MAKLRPSDTFISECESRKASNNIYVDDIIMKIDVQCTVRSVTSSSVEFEYYFNNEGDTPFPYIGIYYLYTEKF